MNYKLLIKELFSKFNIDIKKIPQTNLVIESCEKNISVNQKVVEDILKFFKRIPPFYYEDTRKELKIGGAWKKDLLERRKEQLKLINNLDGDGYSKLLENMFKNELITGLWAISYYDKKLIGKKAPNQFISNLKKFKNLTNLDETFLNDGDFGSKWGVKIKDQFVNFVDPYKGVNTFNISNYLNGQNLKKNIFIDFGSGFGSDTVKLTKLLKSPTRFYLIDIPLNLTTAYAYISHNSKFKTTLISDISDLEIEINKDFKDHEVVFVPSIFVKELSSKLKKVDLMYNHGSFSEMDYETIEFYLDTLMKYGPVKALFEINSNEEKENCGNHIEIPSSTFPIPKEFKLIFRAPTINDVFGHRYMQSLYIKEE